MSIHWKILGVAAGAAITLAAAPLAQLKLQPDSKIWVAGGSTVRDFRCAAKTVDANLTAPSEETATLELARLISGADIAINVDQLDCGNGTMNEHMRKALNSKQHTRIAFKLSSYDVSKEGAITVKGMLTMNGQEKAIELTGTVSEEAGIVRTTATRQINMTEWGVKPPSLMLGTMKVKPVVTIGYDIAVKR